MTEPATFIPNSWNSEQTEAINLKATAGNATCKSNITSLNSSLSRKMVAIKFRAKCTTDSSATSTNYFGNEHSYFSNFEDSHTLPPITETETLSPTLPSHGLAVKQKIQWIGQMNECSNLPNLDGNRKRAKVGYS